MALISAKQVYDSAEKSRQMNKSGPPVSIPQMPSVGGIQRGKPINRF